MRAYNLSTGQVEDLPPVQDYPPFTPEVRVRFFPGIGDCVNIEKPAFDIVVPLLAWTLMANGVNGVYTPYTTGGGELDWIDDAGNTCALVVENT